jgi:hypothetical protein
VLLDQRGLAVEDQPFKVLDHQVGRQLWPAPFDCRRIAVGFHHLRCGATGLRKRPRQRVQRGL